MGEARHGWMHRPLTMHSSTLQSDRSSIRNEDTAIQQSEKYSGSRRHDDTARPQPHRCFGLGQDDDPSTSLFKGHNGPRYRASGEISPPPLKRQRTDGGISMVSLSRPGRTKLPTRSSSNSDLVKRSFDGLPTSLQRESKWRQDRDVVSRHSCSFAAPPLMQYPARDTVTTKARHSDIVFSSRPSGSRVTVKRVCRVCEKSSATNYNPIFACPGCTRPYHDSCRKPPLIDGVDPQRWRCSRCLFGKGVRTFIASSARGESRRSSEHVASFHLPDRSSQPPLLQSDRHIDTTLPVTDSDPNGIIAKHGTVSHMKIPFGSDTTTSKALHEDDQAVYSCTLEHKNESKSEPVPSGPLFNSELGSVEVLNTSTRRSSELDVSGSLSHARLDNEYETEIEDDSFLAIDQPLVGTIATLTVLCATCRIQRVFAKDRGDSIHCRNCRNQSLTAQAGKLEVPETPHATSQINICATQSTQPKDTLTGNSPIVPTLNSIMPWFQSNLIVSKPNIKQKKVGDEVILNTINALHEPILEQYESDETSQVTDALEQVLVCKQEPSVEASPMLGTSEKIFQAYTVEKSEVQAPNDVFLEQARNDEESPPSPSSARVSPTNDGSSSLNPVIARDDRANQAHDETVPLPSIETEHAITSHTGHASPDMRASSERIVTPLGFEKRYNVRELARIALSAADDTGLTTVEITDWLAKTFTFLQKGQRPWGKTLKTKLSTFPEFRRVKIPGAGHNKKRYSFVDAATRARYRAVFAEYCPVIVTPLSEAGGTSGLNVKPPSASKEARPSRLSRAEKTVISTVERRPAQTTPKSGPSPSTQVAPKLFEESLSKPSKPFERAVERIPKVHSSDIQEFKHEISYEAFLKAHTWSVESMTEEQRAKKIAQIKARPSRKQFFGSDHRLGHVRRYRREDIHDESDGAWKASLMWRSNSQTKRNEDVSMKDGPTLREVFDLPENAVPMNDGQTELAFRDGTRINGRLPRSRQIYKVGKMSGGELTIRTS
ncbi:hypothetical protein T440DRAFT_472409 [Plenodomus tracheiphilus IPT5]|uniref:PHD-type domain-containing protein n=1 Tax=Plenodomus tracheiphilus IPT5 TaxID=1408161 RepID=A0A6A7AR41_9PLEO|nr:hypothetical protein T440DRAFT_472409 [Plenodomus tracheiphilus IPT5]